MSQAVLRALVKKLKETPLESVVITDYCREQAACRRMSPEEVLKTLRGTGVTWAFSQHTGKKGTRIVGFKKISSRRAWEGIFEVNDKVYLINALVLDSKKQMRYKGMALKGEDADVL